MTILMNAITDFLPEQTKQEQQREAVEAFLQPHVLSAKNPHLEELWPGGLRIHDWRTYISAPSQGDGWDSLSLDIPHLATADRVPTMAR